MTNQVATKFADGASPFKRPKVKLVVADDKPVKTGTRESKYAPIFSLLERGQCIRRNLEEVNHVGMALKAWLKRNKLPGRCKQMRLYPGAEKTETPSRVWWI